MKVVDEGGPWTTMDQVQVVVHGLGVSAMYIPR